VRHNTIYIYKPLQARMPYKIEFDFDSTFIASMKDMTDEQKNSLAEQLSFIAMEQVATLKRKVEKKKQTQKKK
jgi:hypothetical protein